MKFTTRFLSSLDACADENLHTLSCVRLLMLVHLQDQCSMSWLAARVGMSTAAMTGTVDKMEAMGLIERVSTRSDRRINYIVLTDKGTEFISKLQSL